jgi:YD repeat-containing protein
VSNLQNLSDTGTEAALLTSLTALRNALADKMVTTYTYLPLIGVSTITDAKGDKMTYMYDAFRRLDHVKDNAGNIISENQYNYKQ